MRRINAEIVEEYRVYLVNEEKSKATIEKYTHDVMAFAGWLFERAFDKTDVLKYKSELITKYKSASVNSVLSSLNSFFNYCGWYELKVKTLKIQRPVFTDEENVLSKSEYERLLKAAENKKNERLCLLMQTICSTGIRVSELGFITVEAVKQHRAEIQCKGKKRTVFLPIQLCKLLMQYIKSKKIKSGAVFVTKNGNPLDRSNIWSEMKKLCKEARVSEDKVFPHNLRHLFARTYYTAQKDIVRLADILGHSNINTTRIYTIESGEIHCRQIQKLGLLRSIPHNID